MASADTITALSAADGQGHIEIDETLVGGKLRHHGRASIALNKTIVFGIVAARRSRSLLVPCRTKPSSPSRGSSTRTSNPVRRLAPMIITPTAISARHTIMAQSITRAKEYVRGMHHANSLEGHWSLLKRAIKGTHVHISTKHSWKYISEFSYRRNMRHSHWAMFNLLGTGFFAAAPTRELKSSRCLGFASPYCRVRYRGVLRHSPRVGVSTARINVVLALFFHNGWSLISSSILPSGTTLPTPTGSRVLIPRKSLSSANICAGSPSHDPV